MMLDDAILNKHAPNTQLPRDTTVIIIIIGVHKQALGWFPVSRVNYDFVYIIVCMSRQPLCMVW